VLRAVRAAETSGRTRYSSLVETGSIKDGSDEKTQTPVAGDADADDALGPFR
jgi:hypothetical protein